MDGWVGGWVGGWMDEWMGGWVSGWVGGRVGVWVAVGGGNTPCCTSVVAKIHIFSSEQFPITQERGKIE